MCSMSLRLVAATNLCVHWLIHCARRATSRLVYFLVKFFDFLIYFFHGFACVCVCVCVRVSAYNNSLC